VKKGAADLRMEDGFLDGLRAADWPGNVRELENVIDRALVLRQHDDRLIAEDLPPGTAKVRDSEVPFDIEIPDEGLSLAAVEKHLIRKALDKTGGNQSRAARLLGITRQTLLYRLEKHGLK
jgi:transcriptional regulator with PAS, ATPase and Fis domain